MNWVVTELDGLVVAQFRYGIDALRYKKDSRNRDGVDTLRIVRLDSEENS